MNDTPPPQHGKPGLPDLRPETVAAYAAEAQHAPLSAARAESVTAGLAPVLDHLEQAMDRFDLGLDGEPGGFLAVLGRPS